jgi:hypothetical protein
MMKTATEIGTRRDIRKMTTDMETTAENDDKCGYEISWR